MSEAGTPPRPRRKPKQARSQSLVQAICEAAVAILRERGPEALTTNAIAERAGVGIGSLYRYYPDKQAILNDVFEAMVCDIDRRYRETVAANTLDAMPLASQIRFLIETPVRLSRDLLTLHGEFFRRHYRSFEISYRHGPDEQLSWVEWSTRWWPQTLARHRGELRISDVELGARVMLMSARGAIDAAIERDPQRLYDDAFVEELVDMACRYLLR